MMSQEKQIEVVTYERERLDYFTELMQLARTRYNLLYHKFKDAPYVSEEHQMLSDMGREVQFFGDVVEMLENGYRKQSEGKWNQQMRPYDDFIVCSSCDEWFNLIDNCTEKFKFCPNCGARMKGGAE